MRTSALASALAALLVFAGPAPSFADGDPAATAIGLDIQGRVAHPVSLALADLRARPALTVEVEHVLHDNVQQKATYTGALLWTLLTDAEPMDEPGRNTRLQHVVVAHGRDGYAISIAIGELDPGFEGKQVIVAYEQDGRALPALRLVVPGDVKPGRSVRDVVSIELR